MNGKKRLRLSKNSKIIGGVCGGIAEFLNLDPSLVRIAVVLITVLSIKFPIMALIYIVCWAILPHADADGGGDVR